MRRSGVAFTLALALWATTARAQPVGASFDYRLERRVTGVSGAYGGWSDELLAVGHYEVGAPAGASLVSFIHGRYQWRYTSPESRDSGSQDRTVSVDAQRRYLGQTDLDEYDGQDAATLTTWVFVPTTLTEGQELPILDQVFRVTSTHATVAVAGAPRTAITLRAAGSGTRDDAYGRFDTGFVDEYWFDAATGMFLRELRTESDVGTSPEGNASALEVREEVYVVDASYAPHVGPIPPDPMLRRPTSAATLSSIQLLFAALVAGGVLVLLFFVLRRVLRPRATMMLRGRPIETRKLAGSEPVPTAAQAASNFFGPFLPHFVEVARRTDDAVWVATHDQAVVGLAIDDAAARVATIFAPEPDVCEALRRSLGRQDFFAEMRHGNLASVIDAANASGKPLPAGVAYNVLETYEVLRLAPPTSPVFDTRVVSRLEEGDVAAAAELLTRVLGTPCAPYLRAALATGDIGYVARVDGRIVGVGLATVVGREGRLHTLAVDPAHRNAGLGRELVRARIRAMAALGAERIITEISAQNSASLEIVRGEGFASVGTMYVETARDTAPATPATTVRR